MNQDPEVVIVGGGLAGLACAVRLDRAGVAYELFEAEPEFGGRVRTTVVDGYRLDHGFQVLLTGYPEARDVFDYEGLDLGFFDSGARIYRDKQAKRVVDPRRHPIRGLSELVPSVGGLGDRLRLWTLLGQDPGDQDDRPTRDWLQEHFSEEYREQFLEPFLGGVFLDPELETSHRLAHFILSQFFRAPAALPNQGIQRLADQLVEQLDRSRLQAGTPVTSVDETAVTLESGRTLDANQVVVAVDAGSDLSLATDDRSARSTETHYFRVPDPPVRTAELCLLPEAPNGVRHFTNLTAVAPGYAAAGDESLFTVTLYPSEQTEPDVVKRGIARGTGFDVDSWQHLEAMEVTEALPRSCQLEPTFGAGYRRDEGIFYAGDYLATPSINGALRSGREVADAVLEGDR